MPDAHDDVDVEHPLGRPGHMIVAIAEPHRDTIDAYDMWFEANHMYDAVLVGPGAFAANRFVATRALKAKRHPLDGGVFADATIGSYVALYYLAPGTAEQHFAWAFGQSAWLGATGRNNPDRTLVLTWLCDAVGARARDGHRVPPQVALDHPYAGLVMVWIERRADGSLDDLRGDLLDVHVPALFADVPALQQVQLWAPRDFPDTKGTPTTPGTVVANPAVGNQLLALCFLDADPTEHWPRAFAALDERLASTGARLRLVAPFVPTVRGAGTRFDELW